MSNYRFPKDPYAERESKNYDNPLPSREYILQVLEKKAKPLTLKQLVKHFRLYDDELDTFKYRLRAMERDGQLVCNRRGGYGLLGKMSLVAGKVQAHKEGFGFLIPDEGDEDYYLSPYEMRQVFHGDRVLIRATQQRGRQKREGSIARVLERNTQEVVGRYLKEHGVPVIVPENKKISQDILISQDNPLTVEPGQIVVAQIISPPDKKRRAVARITEVLGAHMAPGMEIDIAIRAYGLPHTWPDAVAEKAKTFPDEVARADKADREDIRHIPLVTIDGASARDFDDAVFCERTSTGDYRLIVAIADVSHYVKPGDALDEEAYERGNSVYFPDHVIPMLPHVLSNGLCSLNPHVDRLCLACEAVISPSGEVKKSRFFAGVMKSHARLIYNNVAAYLQGEATSIDDKILPHIDALHDLYNILAARREQRGAISFETQETEIIFDENRKIKNISPIYRNVAHQIIEEFMLVANVQAAKYLKKHKMPLLYRVHDKPKLEKLIQLRLFLNQLGLSLNGGEKPSPKDYASLLAATRERDDSQLLQTVLLRSMAQAEYSPDNIGHFGLAFEAYTHFTSPIRRYPDLLVHRAIRAVLTGDKHVMQKMQEGMQAAAERCSMTERRADDATRDVIAWLKCEYMQDKVGEDFSGIISGVTNFGFFVELKEVFVEGLVHVSTLKNDYYTFDEVQHALIAQRSQTRYRLGDAVQVKVARVDLDDRKIDFSLVV